MEHEWTCLVIAKNERNFLSKCQKIFYKINCRFVHLLMPAVNWPKC